MRDEEEEEAVRTTMWGAHVRNVWISWGGSGGWEQGETSTPDLEQPRSHLRCDSGQGERGGNLIRSLSVLIGPCSDQLIRSA